MRSVHLIYFSSTGTTRKVFEAVARGFAADDPERLDLTGQGDDGGRQSGNKE
jgi:flavodoxin